LAARVLYVGKPLLHSGMAQERPANVKAVTTKRPAARVLYVGKPLVHSGRVMERTEYVQLVIRGISVAKEKINRSHLIAAGFHKQ